MRRNMHGLPAKLRCVGPVGIRVFLVVASRAARGLTTSYREAADAAGVTVKSVGVWANKLRDAGLLMDASLYETRAMWPAGNFALEFVPGVPRCLREKISDRANRAAANAHTVGSPSVAGEPSLRAA